MTATSAAPLMQPSSGLGGHGLSVAPPVETHVSGGRFAASARLAGWTVASLAMIAIVAQPVGVTVQLALGITAIAVMAGLWMWTTGPLTRMTFLATGSLVILRYIYWRATNTLPSIDEPVSFVFGIVLFAAEAYCVVFLAINLIINADPMERKPAAAQPDERLPTVDIFVPSYNEDEAILAVTLSAAKSMDYPSGKLTVWLLDDGGTDQKCSDANPQNALAAQARRASLMILCEKLGVNYLTRARNEHAKAGNLNAGLNASHGEIVVVFDADHVPFRPFLRETIGYFAEDDRLFLVQTPHVFLNPDPIEKNLATFDRMPSENEMFYSITQRGLDKWNGSFFCGSAALLRRAALKESNGFSGVTITEDCETAFELHAKGWTSLYVDKPLIAGLQPETFASFIGQRLRWCQGMFQIMLLKNPALKHGLKPVQRLAYLSSMMFWLFPLPRLIFMFAPLLHIFFDVRIFTSSLDETIAYTATYVVVNVMIQSYMFGHVRWPWMSELYEYVQGLFLLRAIASVVASPRKPTFNVTAKGQSLDRDHLSSLAYPFVAVFLLLAAGVLTAGYRYTFEPGVTNLMLVVGLWAAVNLVVAGVALGAVSERKQVDRSPRLAIERKGTLTLEGRSIDVVIDNVSAVGCSVQALNGDVQIAVVEGETTAKLFVTPLGDYAPPAPLTVKIARSNTGPQSQSWGLAFEQLEAAQYFAIAELMYADGGAITRFLGKRRKRKSFVLATLQFLTWGIGGPLRALHYWHLGRSIGPIVQGNVEASVQPTLADTAHSVANIREVAPPIALPAPAEAVPSVATWVDDIRQNTWMESVREVASAEKAVTDTLRAIASAREDLRPSPHLASAVSAPVAQSAAAVQAGEIRQEAWLQSLLEMAAAELAKSAAGEGVASNSTLRVA